MGLKIRHFQSQPYSEGAKALLMAYWCAELVSDKAMVNREKAVYYEQLRQTDSVK